MVNLLLSFVNFTVLILYQGTENQAELGLKFFALHLILNKSKPHLSLG